jgi:hypothetical protein
LFVRRSSLSGWSTPIQLLIHPRSSTPITTMPWPTNLSIV